MTANGIKFHYVVKGDRTKPLMLMLHGFPEVRGEEGGLGGGGGHYVVKGDRTKPLMLMLHGFPEVRGEEGGWGGGGGGGGTTW